MRGPLPSIRQEFASIESSLSSRNSDEKISRSTKFLRSCVIGKSAGGTPF